ncbi:MAG TPA: tRNA lysidine(34) synthetase TilS, partial [Candidatus Acidoferrales bacterium]|nr:tRNA lysidine(34) synthetase TilS [Candidatus Acidoferrales bacterium]
NMLVTGERVVVGLSGGPDSVALLAALIKLSSQFDLTVMAAHLNHGLRGVDALNDQIFAQQIAERLGTHCEVGTASISSRANVESQAREARYAFLFEVAKRFGACRIATAHTVDDQAETFILRLLRGAGWDGLRGIAPVREDGVIRPLIDCRRQEVMTFLTACELPFRIDQSNCDRRFSRNRIRHEVMPLLTSFNPSVASAIAATASLMTAGAEVIHRQLRATLEQTRRLDGALDVAALTKHGAELGLSVVREWLRESRGTIEGLRAVHFEAVLALALSARPNAAISLPRGLRVVREYSCIRLVPAAAISVGAVTPVSLPETGTVQLETGWRLNVTRVGAETVLARPADRWSLHADAENLAGEIMVRAAQRGDRLRPLGMQGNRRKLQDIFVDCKVPRGARATYPLLSVDNEILWVPGLVRGAAAAVTSKTRSVLRVTAEPPSLQESGIAGGDRVC